MAVKDRVLQALLNERCQTVSGQMLANELGVSRAAVWKAIHALRLEGYTIQASTNNGYCLVDTDTQLRSEKIRSLRTGEWAESPVFVLDEVDSTNTEARRMALNGVPHGTLVIADAQTAGRGRRGKAFFSPRGTGLYMSIVLRTESKPEEAFRFTLAAAVAACNAVRAVTGIQLQVKWVNDLMLGGKKVAGLLTEAVTDFEIGLTELVIIGFGINLTMPEDGFPESIRDLAGVLSENQTDRNRLAAEISDELERALADLPSELLDRYRALCIMPGKNISFTRDGKDYAGMALSVLDDGALLVRLDDGTETELRSGEVSLRR